MELNINLITTKLLEENICNFGVGKELLEYRKKMTVREKVHELDYIKINNIYYSKSLLKMKR